MVIRYAFGLWTLFMPRLSVVTVLTILVVYLTGMGLLAVAVFDIDLEAHGRAIAAVVLAVLIGSVVSLTVAIDVASPGPDALLFSRYSVDLLLAGQNPFAASMEPAWDIYGTSPLSVTPTVDGGHVASLSYPAGAVLAFVPQAVLGVPNLGLTAAVLTLGAVGFLIAVSPAEFALAPIAVVLSQDMIQNAFLGSIDILWILPVLVAMVAWGRHRYVLACIPLGIAVATKQQPWIIVPFLGIWLFRELDVQEATRVATACLFTGSAVFLVLNGAFIIWDPMAWASSVLAPLGSGATLVQQGVGLAMLSTSGLFVLPKSFFTIAVGVVVLNALILYALFWDRLKWVAWIMPAFVLFLHYRSLHTYILSVVPIAYYAVLQAHDLDIDPRFWRAEANA
jgi:uncharacterized membrane protein